MEDAQQKFQSEVMTLLKEKFKSTTILETDTEKERYKLKAEQNFNLLTDENKRVVLDDLLDGLSDSISNATYVKNSANSEKTAWGISIVLFFFTLPFSFLSAIAIVFLFNFLRTKGLQNELENQYNFLKLKLDLLYDFIAITKDNSGYNFMLRADSIRKALDTLTLVKEKENLLPSISETVSESEEKVDEEKKVDKEQSENKLNMVSEKESDDTFKSAEYVELESKIDNISTNLTQNFEKDKKEILDKLVNLKNYFHKLLHSETDLDEIMQEKVDEQLKTSIEFIDLVHNQICSNDFILLKNSLEWKNAIMEQFDAILTKMQDLEQEIASVYIKTLEEEFKILFGEEVTEEVLSNFDINAIKKSYESIKDNNKSEEIKEDISKEKPDIIDENEEKRKIREAIKEVTKIQEFR